jgi:hypothetical protein
LNLFQKTFKREATFLLQQSYKNMALKCRVRDLQKNMTISIKNTKIIKHFAGQIRYNISSCC